jgi:hypothetical protein
MVELHLWVLVRVEGKGFLFLNICVNLCSSVVPC